jgi:general L-amino acid transport system permease protein
MATTSPPASIRKEAAIPFWRDVRVLAIFGQIIFIALVIAGLAWLISNFIENARAQGLQLSFGFLNTTAAFDIAEGIDYEPTDTFGKALWVGIVNTIRVSFFGIILSTLLGTIAGIARLSSNWLISKLAEVYVEIIRNIPLLVFLFFIHFGVTLKLPPVRESIQPLGWPIFLSQRGVVLPSLTPTLSFPIWLAFIILGVILVMALWTIQSRQEEQTGRPINKAGSAIWAFLIVVAIGWFVTSAFISDQAIMVASSRNIQNFDDFEAIYAQKLDKAALAELGVDRPTLDSLNSAEAIGAYKTKIESRLKEETLEPAEAEALREQLTVLNGPAITICSVADSPAEINAASQLRRRNIPVKIQSGNTIHRASAAYAAGDCDLLAGRQVELAAERAILEAPDTHELVSVSVTPLITNLPALAGFNIQGGARLTPEYASLLFGLFVYHGAFAAELVRAGILSVSKGQSEAARALGLSEGQRLRLIILPQAMRVIIPPMTSNYLSLAKNSSLAIAIGYPDLVAVGNTVINQAGLAIQVIVIFMVAYLTISLTISAFLNWYNKKVALVER